MRPSFGFIPELGFIMTTNHCREVENYLFCGDDEAAQRAAVVYSLLATSKAHGVNKRAWLEDVLRRVSEYEQGTKGYADTLPRNWSATSAKYHKLTFHFYKKTATGISM